LPAIRRCQRSAELDCGALSAVRRATLLFFLDRTGRGQGHRRRDGLPAGAVGSCSRRSAGEGQRGANRGDRVLGRARRRRRAAAASSSGGGARPRCFQLALGLFVKRAHQAAAVACWLFLTGGIPPPRKAAPRASVAATHVEGASASTAGHDWLSSSTPGSRWGQKDWGWGFGGRLNLGDWPWSAALSSVRVDSKARHGRKPHGFSLRTLSKPCSPARTRTGRCCRRRSALRHVLLSDALPAKQVLGLQRR